MVLISSCVFYDWLLLLFFFLKGKIYIYLKCIKSLHRATISVPEFVKRQCNRGLIQHDGKLHISIFNVFQTFSRPKSGNVSVFTFPMRRQGIGECWITDCKNVEKNISNTQYRSDSNQRFYIILWWLTSVP